MKSTILLAGLYFICVAVIVAGLLPQLAPGATQSVTFGAALVIGAIMAAVLGVIVSQDDRVNR